MPMNPPTIKTRVNSHIEKGGEVSLSPHHSLRLSLGANDHAIHDETRFKVLTTQRPDHVGTTRTIRILWEVLHALHGCAFPEILLLGRLLGEIRSTLVPITLPVERLPIQLDANRGVLVDSLVQKLASSRQTVPLCAVIDATQEIAQHGHDCALTLERCGEDTNVASRTASELIGLNHLQLREIDCVLELTRVGIGHNVVAL